MSDLTERHEVRVRGTNQTISFVADSDDGRLFIRVEADGKKGKDVCAIRLANPEELHAFFKGLRRIVEALGHNLEPMEGGNRGSAVKPRRTEAREDDRDADAELYADVRELARQKYGWGDGLPVEFRLGQEI